MAATERTLAERARSLLRAGGGRANDAELVAGLFGPAVDASRWSGLVRSVLAPLPDVQRAADGRWELVSTWPSRGDRLGELSFIALAAAAVGGPGRARLVALAAVRVQQGRAKATFELTCNPRRRLPRYLLASAGLTETEVAEAPLFEEVVDDLLGFLEEEPLIGVDIRAQAETLGLELSLLERPGLRNPLVDLGTLASRLGLSGGKPSLPSLAARTGLTHSHPYRPASDTRVVARLAVSLLKLAESRGLATSELLLEEQNGQSAGALLHPSPRAAPEAPGVYLLKGADGRILYVGKARNLGRRLASYHRRPLGILRRLDGLAESVAEVETIAASSELEALILEARFLRRHAPPYNTQRRARRPALFLRADLSKGRAMLTACRTPAADGACYLGPFRTASAAAGALGLVRQLFPGLKSRAVRRAAERRPLVQAAIRFLSGQKREVLDRLRAEQRTLAQAGQRAALADSIALLRRAVAFSFDAALPCAHPLEGRLLVLSPGRGERVTAHLVEGGRLLACFEAANEAEARRRAAACRQAAEHAPDGKPGQEADEPSIVFRWLCGLGPEHRIEPLRGILVRKGEEA